jgi:hypothetical protein
MPSSLLARLDAAYARTQNPDQIAAQIMRGGWVKGSDFTDEMIDEWADKLCVVYNSVAARIIHDEADDWRFWFHRSPSDRLWLGDVCGELYFIQAENYFEGSLP